MSDPTTTTSDPDPAIPAGQATAGPIGEVDRLLGETFRLGVERSGHLLPYVLFFVLSLALVGAIAGWYGLRDTVVTLDETSSTVDVDYGGSPVALGIYLAIFPISMIGGVLAKAATARQAWTAQLGRPEPWSASLTGALSRWRSVLFGAVGRTATYWVLGLGFLFGSALVPALILTFPLVVALFVFVWLRFSFISQAAVLAPRGAGPFATSYRVSAGQPWPLLWRLVVLALIGAATLIVVSLAGSMITALAGVESTVEVDPDRLVYDLNAYLGHNLAVFALGSAFGALGLGADYVLAAIGTTLLYRNLGGPVDPSLMSPPEPEPGPRLLPVVESGR